MKTIWTSDTDINGLDTVARVVKGDGEEYFLEVSNNSSSSIMSRIKMAWKILIGNRPLLAFVILSDKDKWVRGIDSGEKDS